MLGKSDPLIRDALQTILERGDFIRSLPDESPGGAPAGDAPAPIETDPAIVAELIGRSQASIATRPLAGGPPAAHPRVCRHPSLRSRHPAVNNLITLRRFQRRGSRRRANQVRDYFRSAFYATPPGRSPLRLLSNEREGPGGTPPFPVMPSR